MNTGLLALLGLGTVAAIAAASSKPSSQKSSVLADAETMVRIYELYSRKLTSLSPAEQEELATLNGKAWGFEYVPIGDFVASRVNNPNFDMWSEIWTWRIYYLLPKGTQLGGPDVFSAWAGGQTQFVCDEYYTIVSQPYPCYRGRFVDFFGRTTGNYQMDLTVHGQSDLMAIGEGYVKDFKKIWEVAGKDLTSAIANAASNYPGIGTVIASTVTFLSEVGSGASLEDATIAAGRAAVPSTLRSAYDVGVGLAVNGELDEKALATLAMSFAISEGVIDGEVLERYNEIKRAYNDSKEAADNLRHTLEKPIQLAT